jgi:dTDP-4-dehydrorhamnose reductase
MVDDIKPEIVVHCAALSSPDACEVDRYACHRMNVELTKRIVSACVDYNVHLVFLSTDFIFDGSKGSYTEMDAPNPVNYYGESKLEAEKLIQASGVVNTIVRTSLVYGVETKLSRPNIITRVIDNLSKNKQYKVPSDQIRTPTYAPDLASAISHICLNRATGIYNISGDQVISVADFAILAAKAFNLNPELLLQVNSNDLTEAAPRPKNTSLDISKAKNDLNFKPTPIEMALGKIKITLVG